MEVIGRFHMEVTGRFHMEVYVRFHVEVIGRYYMEVYAPFIFLLKKKSLNRNYSVNIEYCKQRHSIYFV